ncbi:hypothetical protein [Amycolatopsis anabasis]|nr:hypothetical protein [Amycolatopsis anabasis]
MYQAISRSAEHGYLRVVRRGTPRGWGAGLADFDPAKLVDAVLGA